MSEMRAIKIPSHSTTFILKISELFKPKERHFNAECQVERVRFQYWGNVSDGVLAE